MPANLSSVTDSDIEIMKRAPGTLYNKSVIGLDQQKVSSGNLKKEEKDALDLKKAAHDRKVAAAGGYFKPDGTINEKLLTPKQLEAAMLELEKESKIRDDIISKQSKSTRIYKLLYAVFKNTEVLNLSILKTVFEQFLYIAQELKSSKLCQKQGENLLLLVGEPIMGCKKTAFQVIHNQAIKSVRKNCKRIVRLIETSSSSEERFKIIHIKEEKIYHQTPVCLFTFTWNNYYTANLSSMKDIYNRMKTIPNSDARYLPVQNILQKLILQLPQRDLRVWSKKCLDQLFETIGNDCDHNANDDELFEKLLFFAWHQNEHVRLEALNLLNHLSRSNQPKSEKTKNEVERKLFTLVNSPVSEIQFEAEETFNRLGYHEHNAVNYIEGLYSDLLTADAHDVQLALGYAITSIPELETAVVIKRLVEIYKNHFPNPSEDILAKMKRGMKVDPKDVDPFPWVRKNVALCLQQIQIDNEHMHQVFDFFLPEPLNDFDLNVRKEMLEAAKYAIQLNGKGVRHELLPKLDEALESIKPSDSDLDGLKQNLVILIGTLAVTLDKHDKKVTPIIERGL